MRKLRALDLFCCAGGASTGLQAAGFEVTGVDVEKHARYPFTFIHDDALKVPLEGYDFIWASPPCQGYTALRHAPGTKGAPLLIDQVRERLIASGIPWVIENVEEAKWAMRSPVTLCGSMFDLGSGGFQLRRHRLFEANFVIPQPDCKHAEPVIGVYGGHARCRSAKHGGRGTRDFIGMSQKAMASEAMGIGWMTLGEMSEAIPPAYAQHIGRAALLHIDAIRLAA